LIAQLWFAPYPLAGADGIPTKAGDTDNGLPLRSCVSCSYAQSLSAPPLVHLPQGADGHPPIYELGFHGFQPQANEYVPVNHLSG
jgi:hypothetical protein